MDIDWLIINYKYRLRIIVIGAMSKPVSVLYLGSLTHSDETNFMDRSRPHEDEIEFQAAVRVALIRIPRPGKDIYSRHISITQVPIGPK